MNSELIFSKYPYIESNNLVLKKIEEENVNDLFEIYDNDKVFNYCGIFPKHNITTVSSMIGHFERDFNKRSRIKLGIFLKDESNKLVGIIEVMNFDQKVNMVTIGYYLSEDYWNKGIASNALSILIQYLFENINVNRIQAEIMPANLASRKVLLKNFFTKEGLIRQGTIWPGKGVVDLELYSILKEDYKK